MYNLIIILLLQLVHSNQQELQCYDILSPTFLPSVPCSIYQYHNDPKNYLGIYYSCCLTHENCNNLGSLSKHNNFLDQLEQSNQSASARDPSDLRNSIGFSIDFVPLKHNSPENDNNIIHENINYLVGLIKYSDYLGFIFYDIYVYKIRCICPEYLFHRICNNDEFFYTNNRYTYHGLLDLWQCYYHLLNYLIIINDKGKKYKRSNNILEDLLIRVFSSFHYVITIKIK
jgi:hypothetical protein